jgi:phosphate-selective porin OprO/OprP
MFKGKFKTERPLSWTMGVMYDGNSEDWHFRQTGLMIGVPEISSNFFIGRTKEGYSQYKVMVGYDIWTIERSPFLDAFIPILGDGIKWIFSMPRHHVMMDLGFYIDTLSENEKFATYDNQIVARVVYAPVVSEREKLTHIAVMGRDAEPDEGSFRAKSKPEAYLAPNYIDTGSYASDGARTFGVEAFYRDGSWLFGGEYGWQWMDAPAVGDPMYHGGNVSVAWLATGEVRGYNVASGFFKAVSPTRTVFEGGPGALEFALNYSYIDTNDGSQPGGTFWRITPLVKWHLMDYLRIEAGYGYGVLDKDGLEGKTHFFQGRILTAL